MKGKTLPLHYEVEMITEPAVVMIDGKPCPLLEGNGKQAKQVVLPGIILFESDKS